MKLSTVIPLLNEHHSLRSLYSQLDAVAEAHGYELDVIFVDDGSTDGSWDVIRDIAAGDERVRGIRLRRNFGKSAALSAGIAAARGDLVLTLDADLQDDPAEIPRFVTKMATGLDVVSGWKKRRHDAWLRVVQSRLFNWMVSSVTGVRLHDHNCGFKCYRPEIFREVRLYGELHRFVPVLAAARGWQVGEIEVNHRPRKFGRSKYGWSRIPKGFLDVLTVKFLTGYGQRPQHLLGTVGLIGFVAGAVGITVLTMMWLMTRAVADWDPVHLHRRAIFFYSLAALLLGSQFMAVGFLAELITATQGRDTDPYSIAERAGDAAAWNRPRPPSPAGGPSGDPAATATVVNAATGTASQRSGGTAMTVGQDEVPAWQRRVMTLLVTTAFMALAVRVLLISNVYGDLPFLGANDRSRWCTVSALVDEGTYEIDRVISRKHWNTIDKVSHYGSDGQQHYYSSKPPLYPTLLAGEYWVIRKLSGWTLAAHPFRVGRTMLLLTNGTLLAVFFWTLWLGVQRWGCTRWGQTYVMACAIWGTFLTTFGVVINNHLPAAASAMVAFYAALRIWYDGARGGGYFFVAGLAAACTVANELPALAFFVAIAAGLFWQAPRQTLLWFLPAAMLVAIGFFATNKLAHDSWRPPYAHRAAGEDWRGDNWYVYEDSYWLPENRQGVDRGEPSKLKYGFHLLVGHHGILSLSPIWILSLWGTWLLTQRRRWHAAAALIAGMTCVCLVFFIGLRPVGDRNYGGVACGFRWVFWLIPLWLVALLPAADEISHSRAGRRVAVLLLVISACAAIYGWPYPWMHPWLFRLWQLFS